MAGPEPAPPTSVPADSSVYYGAHYWNDLAAVREYVNRRTTGDPATSWIDDFARRFCADGPFEHGLFVACGNGWVEREFVDRGLVRRATAFDYSQDLLDAAERDRAERPIDYFQADVNRVQLPEDAFDLAVNVGALHHVQYINRFAALLCRALREDGVLVAYDYIGPGRNQYARAHWRQVRRANAALPPTLRKDRLRRPHLPTMLVDDPTEAIHADLVLESLARFFTITERHDAGGGVAYEIITHNPKFFQDPPAAGLAQHLDRLLATDDRMTAAGRVPPLFSYYIARPVKAAPAEAALEADQAAEDAREAWAARHAGVYSWTQWARLQGERAFWRLGRRAARTPAGRALRTRLRR